MDQSILLDLTEFISRPLRTGIQRVMYQVIRHWRGRCRLEPIRLGTNGKWYRLPASVLPTIHQFFGDCPIAASQARFQLQQIGLTPFSKRDVIVPTRTRGILNLELFFDLDRIDAYYQLLQRGWGDHIYFLVYDLLPWLQPHWFALGTSRATIEYLRLLRRLQHLAFISEATRRDFLNRFLRQGDRQDWPALALGADGLGTAEPCLQPKSRRFTAIGTLEPRKNIHAILEAFDMLWKADVDVELVLVGRAERLEPQSWELLQRLRASSRLQWKEQADDTELRSCILSSQATLFPSLAEGYGLPPLESLALGTPVIVSSALPSLENLPDAGQIRLPESTSQAISKAVLSMLDPQVARQKRIEITGLTLPRWSDLAYNLSQWIEKGVVPEPVPPTPGPKIPSRERVAQRRTAKVTV